MKKHFLKFTIISMAPLAGIGIDIYSPALPMMREALHTSVFWSGFTITIYLIGYALGSSIAGPLSDSLGRLRVLSAGLYVYIIACFLALFVDRISFLLILRLLQGIAVAAPGVMFKVLITDHFDEKTIPAMANNVSIAWALGPVIAPFFGGFLTHHFGWQMCFGVLAVYAAVILIFCRKFLVESSVDLAPLHMKTMINAYFTVLKHKNFMMLVIALSLLYSVFVLFNVNGPFLLQKGLGLNPMMYGTVALILGTAYFIGTTLNRFLIQRFKPIKVVVVGVAGFCAGGLLLFLTGLFHAVTLTIILMGCMLCYFFMGFIFSNTLSRCMLLFRSKAGTANAVMNTSFVLGSALISIAGSHLPFTNQLYLGGAYLMMCLGVASALFFVKAQ